MASPKMDDETGEPMTKLNLETGEMEFIVPSTVLSKPKVFRVPPQVTKPSLELPLKDDGASTFATPLLFLLPTSIFFYPILAVFFVMAEIIIHAWAHRKNNRITNKNIYYQSPLHIIVKEFCGSCREEEFRNKMCKFLEKRADHIGDYGLDYVKRIVM